jgi:hypothetical protein
MASHRRLPRMETGSSLHRHRPRHILPNNRLQPTRHERQKNLRQVRSQTRMSHVRSQQPHPLRNLGWANTHPTQKNHTIQKGATMTDNQNIFYESWITDLQRDLDSLREDKRELLHKVAKLEQLVAEYGNKISNLIQHRGDE